MVLGNRFALRRYLLATVALALLVFALQALRSALNQTAIALALVLLVIATAAWLGRGPALSSAVLAGLAFNFFFIEPYHTFRITHPRDLVAFLAFVATAVLVGQLSYLLKKRVIQTEVQQQQLEQVREEFAQASAQAAEADVLRRSEQLKTALLDAVTHDLRTPLTSIKAAVTTLGAAGVNEEARQELYEVIEQEADRLNRFIQGMMDLAQMEAGRLSVESRPVSADEIIEHALLRAEALLGGHAVEIMVEPQLPSLQVDPRLISQVLFTLTENAVKYSNTGSRISISAQKADGFVRFTVMDEGRGIPAEMKPRLFQKFSRAGSGAGFGLGLAIARGIVQAHNGNIWLEDGEPGKGATFRFQIPIVSTS